MAIVKTTLSLTDLDRKWMERLIASGEYVSNSEYVRNLIRKDKEQRIETPAEIEAIRAALIEGEESGISSRTPEDVKAAVQKRLRDNGQLPSA